MAVSELKRRVRSGEVAPLYLIVGEEGVLREEAGAAIRTAVLGSGDASLGTFNAEVVYGDETEAMEILSLCGNLPMFAARRLVEVRDADALRAKDAEKLLPYLDAPVATTCLMFTADKVDGRVKFIQALRKAAVVVDCGPLEPRALPLWVREEAAALGLTVDEPARILLQEASSGDLGTVRRELEKLAAYVAPAKAVTAADVKAVQGADTGGSVHDLLEALQRKDRGNALRFLGKVLDAGEPPLKILGFLAACWRNMWRSRRFSEEMLRDFEQFREADSRLKGGGAGRGKDRLVMERMVLNVCAARATSLPRPSGPAR
jgi:DNA polymerase-3 subunit delta